MKIPVIQQRWVLRGCYRPYVSLPDRLLHLFEKRYKAIVPAMLVLLVPIAALRQ